MRRGRQAERNRAARADQSPVHDALCATPSLHLGVVRTLGSDAGRWIREAGERIQRHGFYPVVVKLSPLLDSTAAEVSYEDADLTPTWWRYASRMVAGDVIRSTTQDSQTLIVAALWDLLFNDGQKTVRDIDGTSVRTSELLKAAELHESRGIAVFYDSLMHPAEIRFLRHMFGSYFLSISIGAPLSERYERIRAWLLKDYATTAPIHTQLSRDSLKAWWLIGAKPDPVDRLSDDLVLREARGQRFEFESARGGLKISTTAMLDINEAFAQGELFLRSPGPDATSLADPSKAKYEEDGVLPIESVGALDRFISQVFGYPFGTPTADEFGIGMAYVASRLSADLSRRVGAALVDTDGRILGLGKNEVPRPGGGTYDSQSPSDHRDFQLPNGVIGTPGVDPNEREKRHLAALIAGDLRGPDRGKGGSAGGELSPQTVLDRGLRDLTEFGRSVHAEMDAILSASATGRLARGATLYSTTYPCHNCMRHIIHTGIRRVVYVEAYPKSRATILHPDAIHDEWTTPYADQRSPRGADGRPGQLEGFEGTHVEPFLGISSRRHADLFSWVPRKVTDSGDSEKEAGAAVNWDPASSSLRPSFLRLHPQWVAIAFEENSHAFHSMWTDLEKALRTYTEHIDIEHLFE